MECEYCKRKPLEFDVECKGCGAPIRNGGAGPPHFNFGNFLDISPSTVAEQGIDVIGVMRHEGGPRRISAPEFIELYRAAK